MRRGVMMCCLPPLFLRFPVLLWGQAYWPEHSFRRRDCPFIAKGWDISLSPNSFHSWVSPRPPSVIKFHPTSKRHTFQLAALVSPSPTLKEIIKLLAFTLSPLLDGFARVFLRLSVHGDGLMGFSGKTRSNMWILKVMPLRSTYCFTYSHIIYCQLCYNMLILLCFPWRQKTLKWF